MSTICLFCRSVTHDAGCPAQSDLLNRYGVTVHGEGLIALALENIAVRGRPLRLTRAEAVGLAAWLLVMLEIATPEGADVRALVDATADRIKAS